MKPSTRALYSHAELARVFDPRSVAVVGATPNASAAGARAIGQLEKLGFGGRIDLVNARYEEIGGRPCHPSVSALPIAPDSVIITVPRAAVEEVVLDAAKAGARSAIIFAAGYGEVAGTERRAEQDRLTAIARETGMRIIGPNCLGAVNYRTGAALTYTNVPLPEGGVAAVRAHDRAIGLVSQSGGLGFACAQAVQRGVVFSHLLTSGNSSDVDVADLIAFLAGEEGCRAIACVFEAMPEPGRLMEAARLALAAGKPLIINKLGTGDAGAAAALSHSGMLAGAHDVYAAVFEQAGMVMVEDFSTLIETAAFFAKADPAAEEGVVVLASSGGASVMAADKAEAHGVPLPQPGEETRVAIQARLPDFGTARNPCDVTGGVANDLDTFFDCVDLLIAEPRYGMMVTAHPYSVHTANRVRRFQELAERYDKLVCHVWITEYLAGPGLAEAESDPRAAVFRSMERCFATIGAWREWRARRDALLAAAAAPAERLAPASAAQEVAAGLTRSGAVLTEREAKALLARYGVPVIGERIAADAAEAVRHAEALGYPVALKLESPDILHKTEAGVIRLDIRDAPGVADAHAAIVAAASRLQPAPRIHGVLVQAMAPKGVELIVGARFDPQFGPLIVVGAGGVLVELLKDRIISPAPLRPREALRLIDRLAVRRLLEGYRGSAPVDKARLAEIVCRISELIADQAAELAELDVNPLICSGQAIVAVDALIIRRGGKRGAAKGEPPQAGMAALQERIA